MDSNSGSEPRSFVSFRLGNESNDQPTHLHTEERMETSESFVTAISDANMGSNYVNASGASDPPSNIAGGSQETWLVPQNPGLQETQLAIIEAEATPIGSQVHPVDAELDSPPNRAELEATPVSHAATTNVEGRKY